MKKIVFIVPLFLLVLTGCSVSYTLSTETIAKIDDISPELIKDIEQFHQEHDVPMSVEQDLEKIYRKTVLAMKKIDNNFSVIVYKNEVLHNLKSAEYKQQIRAIEKSFKEFTELYESASASTVEDFDAVLTIIFQEQALMEESISNLGSDATSEDVKFIVNSYLVNIYVGMEEIYKETEDPEEFAELFLLYRTFASLHLVPSTEIVAETLEIEEPLKAFEEEIKRQKTKDN